jgi:hypothetical protein
MHESNHHSRLNALKLYGMAEAWRELQAESPHHAVSHDGWIIFDFFKLGRQAALGQCRFKQFNGGFAVGAATAKHFDTHNATPSWG